VTRGRPSAHRRAGPVRRRLLPVVLALAAFVLSAGGLAAGKPAAGLEPEPGQRQEQEQQQQGPGQEPALPALAEQLNVREVELVLEPPAGRGLADLRPGDFQPTQPEVGIPGFHVDGLKVDLPSGRGLAGFGPGDVLVLEDGKSRPVRRLQPLAAAGANPWTLRVYFDQVLARPDTVFEAALALADQAELLVQLGTVELVAADPEPHVLLAPSREAMAIRYALATIAGQARLDPARHPYSRVPPLTPAIVRRQCDRLLTSLAASPAAGAHALLLVADPPPVLPAELRLLSAVSTHHAGSGGSAGLAAEVPPTSVSQRGEASGDGSTALALGETARLLAAYGWVTVALPIHRPAGAREPLPEDDAARLRRIWWSDPHMPTGIPLLPLVVMLIDRLRGKKPPPAPDARLIAPQLDMANAPLVAMVRPTAGLLVSYAGAVAPALGVLAARWHLWYEADASPAARARPVTVSLLASARDLRAPLWVRSSTPEEMTEARLRRMLDGDDLPGSRSLVVKVLPSGAGSPEPHPEPPGPLLLQIEASPASAVTTSAAGPVRVSFAWIDEADRVRIRHQLLDAAALGRWNGREPMRLAAPSPSPGKPGLAVLIEDLAAETWSGAVVPSRPATTCSSILLL
jgi:hypothetical protein